MFQIMGRNLSADQAERYRACYEAGCQLLDRHLLLEGRLPSADDEGAVAASITEGIAYLQEAVSIVPESWPAHWNMGKGYQRLGEHYKSYDAFRHALSMSPKNVDVLREIVFEALWLGRHADAVSYARQAVRLDRTDPALQSNLAIALLFLGEVGEALSQAEQASARSPHDKINKSVLAVARAVSGGASPPKSFEELVSLSEEISKNG